VIAAAVAFGRAMETRPKTTAAGGFPIAIGVMSGAAIGSAMGQATIGFFAGLATGIAVAVVIALRRR
jgi:hypothetical protein